MNIFHKVTLKTLQKNKTRTLVTIIGIILSAAMFTAVTTFISSLQSFMMEIAVYENGDWHGSLYAANRDKVLELKNNNEIAQVAISENIGYSLIADSVNKDKPYLHILGADELFMSAMPIHLITGHLPENSSEIILPKHLKVNGGISHSIGDTLILEIGDRKSSGVVLDQNNPYMDGKSGEKEELVIRENQTYKVVGFYERPAFESFSALGYSAVTVSDGSANPEMTFNTYFKMKNPKDVYGFLQEQSRGGGFSAGFDNRDVLMFSGASRYDSFFTVLYSLAAILMGIIMFGSISLIYNAFAISVSERTKQFGLLSSIGATKKQIRNSVLYEALFVSAIGIPFGIIFGIIGIGITLVCVEGLFASIYNGGDGNISLSLSVDLWSVAIAAVISLITVLISAWIPSGRVSKITAMEAIRQSNDIAIKGKKVKTSKLTYKLFGLEGMIARKQFKRSRKKYRATVISLFMSIVLFISASSFSSYLKDSVEDVFETRNYDIMYYIAPDEATSLNISDIYSALKNVTGVTGSNYSSTQYGKPQIPKEYLTDEYIKANENTAESAIVFAVDDETWMKFLEDKGFDPALYMNKDAPLGIALSAIGRFNYATQIYENYDVFSVDKADFNLLVLDRERLDKLSEEERGKLENIDDYYIPAPMTVGAIVDELPMGINANYQSAGITIMYPASLIDLVIPDIDQQNPVWMYFKADNHSIVYDKMTEVLNTNNLNNGSLVDYAASSETDRNLIIIINVFSYGFIVLISLIAVANVFNTISTNINLRRREFAMLKSVGMTQKGFNKMMNFECLMYGVKSLLWGSPVSVGVTYLIYRSISSGYTTGFYVPWQAMVIAVFSVFGVVFATMMYSMSKINKENPIDALRNENL